jgi:hypothetical protein
MISKRVQRAYRSDPHRRQPDETEDKDPSGWFQASLDEMGGESPGFGRRSNLGPWTRIEGVLILSATFENCAFVTLEK